MFKWNKDDEKWWESLLDMTLVSSITTSNHMMYMYVYKGYNCVNMHNLLLACINNEVMFLG